MSATKQRRGMHPALAVAMFLVSAGIAGNATFGTWSSTARSADPEAPPVDGGDEAAASGDAADGDEPTVAAGQDLLAVYGSFERGGTVNQAFGVFVEAPVGAAPAGESNTNGAAVVVPAGAWVGEEPPRLRLGVVMLSGPARRAVLDGKVVGVGDTVGTVRVLHIEMGQVLVSWQTRRLTYRLDSDVAVEFRAEAARRQAKGGGDAGAETNSKKDQGK